MQKGGNMLPQIEMIGLDKLQKNPKNPRIIKDEKFKKLVKSIKEFPQMLNYRPILYTDDMIIACGNMRYEACKEIRLKEVPAINVTGLTQKQVKELIVKDNIPFGEWNWSELANDWDTDLLIDWGFDETQFGLGLDNDNNKTDGNNDGIDLKETFKIEIDCKDESTQEKIYNEMQERGFECRLLTL